MPQEQDQQRSGSHVWLLAGFCLLVILGGMGWLLIDHIMPTISISLPWQQTQNLADATSTMATSSSALSAELSGYVFVSLVKLGENNARLYEIDMAHKTLQAANVQAFNPSGSVDGRYVVGAYLLSTTSSMPNGIYRYDVQSGVETLLAKQVGAEPPIMPHLSPDNSAVVFNESLIKDLMPTSPDFYKPSSWGVYVAQTGAMAKLIAHGIYPHWSPDGSTILYLGDDGLHTYAVATSKDTLVYPVTGGSASTRLMFTISKDGSKIAWADPDQGRLFVGDITSWQPFKIAFSRQISAYAFWPVFSPDGTKLAYGQFDSVQGATSTQITNSRLTVIDLESGQYIELLDLSPYSQPAVDMTDWVSNL